jgi:CRISPR type III-A-associated RAMP protein Csm4
MNPGLVVKLRPAGPWRIGPDSGARNKVDAIYHSDTLYGAVTSAMARLGSLDEWLDATARSAAPAVCFSSCFPFLDEIGFVAPPRTVWPPSTPAVQSSRVRWKSARFVPLSIVQSILAGKRLDDGEWTVDGASECLVPAGRQGPFRTGLRWNAAVDRLSGATERHSTACLEFRSGAGLWTVVSFGDDAARDRWMEPVKAAFRWLADSGFGGERSRGWGRSESPEFVEGTLPEMILGAEAGAEAGVGGQGPGAGETASPVEVAAEPGGAAAVERPAEEPSPTPPVEGPPAGAGETASPVEVAAEAVSAPVEPPSEEPSPVPPVEEPPVQEPPISEPPPPEETPQSQESEVASAPLEEASQLHTPEIAASPESLAPGPRPLAPVPPLAPASAHWLLSVFTPAADDSVDWSRGNYTVLTRSGRVDRSGELKKQLPMVAEGSVVYAGSAPRGAALDVAPEGAAHPVFRAGFALSIPLPEVR